MLKTTRTRLALLWTTVFLIPLASHAARPLGPPIEELASRYNIVMVAKAAERIASDRVRFERVTAYYGDAADSIVLRTGETDAPFVEIGRTYVLGYSVVTSDSQFRETKFEDPEGPKIVRMRGVDARAVFADTEHLRFLFEQAVAEQPAAPRKVLDAVLAQMQRDDERARILVALELTLRPDLIELVSPDDGRIIRDVIASEAVPVQTRDFLLRTASRFPAEARDDWLAAAQRAIVKTAPDTLDLVSPMPSYVRTAALGLRSSGDASDVPALGRLLASNAPGVAKAALEAMDALDPDAALLVAREARDDEALLAETRRVLDRYVNSRDSAAASRGS